MQPNRQYMPGYNEDANNSPVNNRGYIPMQQQQQQQQQQSPAKSNTQTKMQ